MEREFWISFAAICQIVFTFVALFDALYYHFFKFRLHRLVSTSLEHVLHTLNAVFFPVTVFFLFCGKFVGFWLWLGIGFTLVTFLVEIFDVYSEKASRHQFDGLPAFEGVLHFLMGLLRAMAFSAILASRDLADFYLNVHGAGGSLLDKAQALLLFDFSAAAAAYPQWVSFMGLAMFMAAIPMALLHIWFCFPRAKV